jgi:hypothetical protein
MEQEFRTTFIPKKPVVAQSASSSNPVGRPVGLLFVISLIIFVVTVGLAGAAYAYQSYSKNELEQYKISLDRVQKNLDTNVIKEFTVMDKRLRNAETLLNQHTVINPVFQVLGTSTLPAVRFTKLELSYDETGNVIVAMSGESDGYRSIALQSQALSKNSNLKNTIFSNFIVTPKGRVSFDMSFMVPRSDVMFNTFVSNLGSNTEISNQVISDTSVSALDGSADAQEQTLLQADAPAPVTN